MPYPTPRATLWMMAYSGISVLTHKCVLKEIKAWPNLSYFVLSGSSALPRSRSQAASNFLAKSREEAGDVFLMVDTDQGWECGDLAHIARKALECNAVIGGIYTMRAFGMGVVQRFDDEGRYKMGSDKLLRATRLGTGFIAIPRTILEALSEKLIWIKAGHRPQTQPDYQPFFLPMIHEIKDDGEPYNVLLYDDWSFCQRVLDCGFDIFASLKPKITHEGTWTYRLTDAYSKPLPDEDMEIKLEKIKKVSGVS